MVVDFSQWNFTEKPVLVLREVDGTAIQTLGYAFGLAGEFRLNET